MKDSLRLFPACFLFLAVAMVFAQGCGDDDEGPMGPDTSGARSILVPLEMSLEEAAAVASPGDSILLEGGLGDSFTLDEALVFRSDQTPLYIAGNRGRPTVVAPADDAAFVFESPRPGTEVRELRFIGSAGAPAQFRITGGEMLVEDCVFEDGQVNMFAEQSARLRSRSNLMSNPSLFGLLGESNAFIRAHQNTISGAGDCGIRVFGGATIDVTSSIIDMSARWGIACSGGGAIVGDSGCNDIFASGTAHYDGCEEPESDFHLNPLFCPTEGDFRLCDNSPCATSAAGDCGQVGARDVGCFLSEGECGN